MRKFIDLAESYVSEMKLLEKTSPSEAAAVLKRHGATNEILADPVRLKAFRAKFMKANHPDLGGSLKDVQDVNDAFDIIGKTGYADGGTGGHYGTRDDRSRRSQDEASKARQRSEEEAAAKARDAENKAKARKAQQEENTSSVYAAAAKAALKTFQKAAQLEQLEQNSDDSDDLYHLMFGLLDAYGYEAVRFNLKSAIFDYNIDHSDEWDKATDR